MKKSLTYILLLGAMLGTVSCDKQNGGSTFADPWEHFGGYMQFATGVNNGISITRGALVDNVRIDGYSFGVRGYIYDNTTSWDIYKNGSNASPNLFDGAPAHNLQVSYGDDGIWSYNSDGDATTVNDKPWDATKLYSFFAYAPYKPNGNTDGLSLSGANYVGTPYIDYTYAWKSQAANSSQNPIMVPGNDDIYDLMTARAIDVSGQSGSAIGFDFEHRLFGIEVLANNYNENYFKLIDKGNGKWGFEYQMDNYGPIGEKDYFDGEQIYTNGEIRRFDPDGSGPLDEQDGYYFLPGAVEPIVKKTNEDGSKVYYRWGRREISNLKITAEGLLHSSTRLYINPEEAADDPDGVKPANRVTFQITNQLVEVPAFNDVDGGIEANISYQGSANHDGYLMFIPQDAVPVNWVLDWDELEEAVGEDGKFNNEFPSNVKFEAGRLYQVIINFVGESITIALIEAGKWTPHDVYYTFE